MGMVSLLLFIKRPKVAIPLIIGLLLAAVVALAIKNMNGPAQGTVTTQQSDNTVGQTNATTIDKTFSDKFVSFNYPSIYVPNAANKGPSYLDNISLIKSERRDQYIAISLVSESLSNDSGVNYRQLHPDLYKKVSSAADTVVFEKNDETEYTGFIQHADKVISISFTAVAPTDMSNDYKMIASSLQWKQ